MRPTNLLHFYRLRLRARWVQELFALVGIAVGVALLFAAQVANTSLAGSVEQLIDGTVGRADLQVAARGPDGFDDDVARRIGELPGIRVAAPLLEVRATAVGPDGVAPLTIIAADTKLPMLQGDLLRRFQAARIQTDHVIALPTPIARSIGAVLGGPVRLDIGARRVHARLGAEVGQREIGSLVDSPIALSPLSYAQRVTGVGPRITRVLVESEPGQSAEVRRRIERLVGQRLNVREADFDVRLFGKAAMPTNQSTALFAGISALVGFLFAFNAMLLTLSERRRLINDLRLDGYSPLQILEVVLSDALVLGLAASALGLALGEYMSRLVFDEAPEYLAAAFPVGDQRIVRWSSVAIAVGGGLLASTLAAVAPLAGLLRRRPRATASAAGSSANAARPLFVAGLAFLAASTAVLVFAPAAASGASIALILALMLMLPAILFGTLRLGRRLLARIPSAVPLISLGELAAMPARSVAVAATGGLAVFGSVAIQGARADLQEGLYRAAADVNAVADIWIAPHAPTDLNLTTPFRAGAPTQVRSLPSVRSVDAYRGSFLDVGDRRVWVVAPARGSRRPVPLSQLEEGDPQTVASRFRTGGWAVVSRAVADDQGVGIGERLTVPAPREATFRVAGLSANLGWAPGVIIVNADDFARAWGTTDPTAYQVVLRPGVSPDVAVEEIRGVLPADSALTVETAADREARQRAASEQGLARLDQLSTLVLIAAILAMAATTGGMVWQRRRRLAALKLDGLDEMTVWRALLLESGLLLGTGCAAGAAFGLYGQQLLERALRTVTGFPVVSSVSVGIAVTSFVLVTVVAVAIAALPGYFAARVPPAAALQE